MGKYVIKRFSYYRLPNGDTLRLTRKELVPGAIAGGLLGGAAGGTIGAVKGLIDPKSKLKDKKGRVSRSKHVAGSILKGSKYGALIGAPVMAGLYAHSPLGKG